MERFFVGPDYRPFILAEGIFDFMIDQYFLVLTTIDLFVLTFMCILTKLSETLNSKQKRGFFLAFVLIGVISILEVITILVDGAPVHLRWLNILSNYLGFGLSPAVSLCLVYVLDKKQGVRRGFKTAVACEAAYLISLALMLPGGMVFSVSEENLYSRGDFFAFYVTAYFAALVYLAACTAITARVFQNRSRVLIYPLIVFLAAETIIQIALPQLHVTWLCVTLLSVLYFIYCSEMWNQIDALTGLLNQNSYLNRTAEMRRSGEVLVVFDVDDFKQVNDRYGHVKGDICLAEIAACIKKAYARHGYCYRMGGDEFCVLLTATGNTPVHGTLCVGWTSGARNSTSCRRCRSARQRFQARTSSRSRTAPTTTCTATKKSAKPTVCQGTRARSNREEAGPWDRRNGARWSKASAQSADCPSYFRVTCRRDTRRPTARLIRWQKRFFSIRPCCKVRRSTRRCSILSTSCGTRSSTSIPSASTR